MSEALFFHAGCPVCVSAEQQFIRALDPGSSQKTEKIVR